jgi:predicted DNA-binding protein with PD1-like motif
VETGALRSRELGATAEERAFVLVFETGDEAMEGLRGFVRERGISAARFTAIGAFSSVVLGYFAWDRKEYERLPVSEQVEALSVTGDVALEKDEPVVHAHAVVGLRDGSTRGGHVLEAHVRPTLEVMLVESPAHLRKRFDPESGLALIDPRL